MAAARLLGAVQPLHEGAVAGAGRAPAFDLARRPARLIPAAVQRRPERLLLIPARERETEVEKDSRRHQILGGDRRKMGPASASVTDVFAVSW